MPICSFSDHYAKSVYCSQNFTGKADKVFYRKSSFACGFWKIEVGSIHMIINDSVHAITDVRDKYLPLERQ